MLWSLICASRKTDVWESQHFWHSNKWGGPVKHGTKTLSNNQIWRSFYCAYFSQMVKRKLTWVQKRRGKKKLTINWWPGLNIEDILFVMAIMHTFCILKIKYLPANSVTVFKNAFSRQLVLLKHATDFRLHFFYQKLCKVWHTMQMCYLANQFCMHSKISYLPS